MSNAQVTEAITNILALPATARANALDALLDSLDPNIFNVSGANRHDQRRSLENIIASFPSELADAISQQGMGVDYIKGIAQDAQTSADQTTAPLIPPFPPVQTAPLTEFTPPPSLDSLHDPSAYASPPALPPSASGVEAPFAFQEGPAPIRPQSTPELDAMIQSSYQNVGRADDEYLNNLALKAGTNVPTLILGWAAEKKTGNLSPESQLIDQYVQAFPEASEVVRNILNATKLPVSEWPAEVQTAAPTPPPSIDMLRRALDDPAYTPSLPPPPPPPRPSLVPPVPALAPELSKEIGGPPPAPPSYMEKQLQKGRQQLEELVSGGKRNFERNWRAGQAKIDDELADNPFLKRIRKVAERLQKNVGETYDFIDPFTPAGIMGKVGEGIIDFTSELYNAPGFAGKVSTILSAPGRAADKLEEFVDYFRSIDIPYEKALEAAKEFVNLDPVAWKEATQGSLGGDTDYKSTKLRYDRIVQKRRDAGEDVSLAAGAEKIVDELNDLGLVKSTSEFLRKPEVRQLARKFGESLQSQEKSIAFAKEYGADPEEVDKKTELFAPGVRILAQIAEGTGDVEVPGTTSKAPAPPAPAPAPPWMVGGGASQVAPGLQAAIPDIAAGGPDVSGFTDRTNAMVDELHAPAPGTAKQPFMDNQMAQALISAGGSMMRSQSPTFLGGLGEGVGAGQAMYHKVGAALAKQAADKAAAASKAYNAQSTRMMAEAQMKTADANVAKYKGKKVKKSMIDELGRLVYTYEGGQKPEIQEGIRFTTGIEKEMFKVAAESVGDILNDLPPEQIADRLIAITNRMLEAKGMPPMQPRQKGINRVSSDKLLPYRK